MKRLLCLMMSILTMLVFAGCLGGGSESSTESSTSTGNGTTYLFQASDNTQDYFFNDGDLTTELTYGTYVTRENLPGVPPTDFEGAMKISYHASNWKHYDRLYLKLNYTATQLEAMKSTYKSATFSVYFETDTDVAIIYQGDKLNMISFVEHYNSSHGANQAHENTWSSYEIPIDSLIKCMTAENTDFNEQTAYIFGGYFSSGRELLDKTINVYISDITLVKKLGA